MDKELQDELWDVAKWYIRHRMDPWYLGEVDNFTVWCDYGDTVIKFVNVVFNEDVRNMRYARSPNTSQLREDFERAKQKFSQEFSLDNRTCQCAEIVLTPCSCSSPYIRYIDDRLRIK